MRKVNEFLDKSGVAYLFKYFKDAIYTLFNDDIKPYLYPRIILSESEFEELVKSDNLKEGYDYLTYEDE